MGGYAANGFALGRRVLFALWIAALILLAAPLMPVGVASGSVYYVATTGDNSDLGTLDRPWRTIQYAVDQARPGDTIYVRGGIYNESVSFHQSGEPESPITLASYDGETVTLNGGESPAIVDTTGTQHWIIEGFTLDSHAQHTLELDAWDCEGTCGGTHSWTIRNNIIIGAVSIYGSHNIFESNEVDGSYHRGAEDGVVDLYDISAYNVFRNNHIHDFASRGIWTRNRTHDNIIENNYIHHIGSMSAGTGMCIDTDGFGNVEWRHIIRGNHLHDCGESGISLENTFDSVVENNHVHDTGQRGIDMINYGPSAPSPASRKCEVGGEDNQYGDVDGDNDCMGDITGNVIRQNLLYRSGWSSIGVYYAGGASILNNTVYHSLGAAIVLYDGEFTPMIEVRGNILANSREAEIRIFNLDSLVVDEYNLFYHPGNGDIYEINRGYYSLLDYQAMTGRGEGSVEGNPRFVDEAHDDFHLQGDSPAIDAGTDVGLDVDFDSNPRPQGAGYDVGVYEYSEMPVAIQPGSLVGGSSAR